MEVITNPDEQACGKAPPEAFSDNPAPDWVHERLDKGRNPERTGPRSTTVELVFLSRTAGDVEPPTPPELYRAMRTRNPTERQRYVLQTWITYADKRQIWQAWAEQAYTWRMFATAMHFVDPPFWRKWRFLHLHADRPELVPPDGYPFR